jgi:hypothetical protein
VGFFCLFGNRLGNRGQDEKIPRKFFFAAIADCLRREEWRTQRPFEYSTA